MLRTAIVLALMAMLAGCEDSPTEPGPIEIDPSHALYQSLCVHKIRDLPPGYRCADITVKVRNPNQ